MPDPGKQEDSSSPATRTVSDAFDERRKFLGGNDGEGSEELRPPEEIPAKELIARAKVHMMATACTRWDNDEHVYKFLPVWGTTFRQLGNFGLGIQLYFQFLCQMGVVFLILSVLTLPLFITNLFGDRVQSEGSQQIFGMMSVANLGVCGENFADCLTTADMMDRPAGLDAIGLNDELKVRELTPVFGTLDGLGLLLFMSFGVFFTCFWVPRVKRHHDEEHVTPADFTLRVRHLPRSLPGKTEDGRELHKDYEKLLEDHFTNLLRKRCGVEDDKPVQEVTLVREYHGAIDEHIVQGQCVLEKKDLNVRIKKADTEEKKEALRKQVDKVNKRIVKMEKAFGKNAGMRDEDRHVCQEAFVIFKKAIYTDKLLHEYRYAESRLFRHCLQEDLKFYGSNPSIENAIEPSDIFWENMDFYKWYRRGRVGLTCLITLILLILCLIALLYCKMISVNPTTAPPSQDLWVLMTEQTNQCLTICNWKFFSDAECRKTTDVGSFVKFWEPTVTNGTDYNRLACPDDFFRSRYCEAGAPPDEVQWFGVELSKKSAPGCMTFEQQVDQSTNEALSGLRLFSCDKLTLEHVMDEYGSLSAYDPVDHCVEMRSLKPIYDDPNDNFVFSGQQPVQLDTVCAHDITDEAAKFALEAAADDLLYNELTDSEEDARYTASTQDNTINCYCTQQQKKMGIAGFRAPPYNKHPAKITCKDWIQYKNLQLTMMGVGVAAVCLLNQILVLVLTYLVFWEKHSTFTSLNSSMFVKLLIAQFVNTAVVVLLVNAYWGKPFSDFSIFRLLQLGKGTYVDFDSSWFAAVGSGLCLTVGIQVFSSTTPGVIMSWVVNPILIWFFKRGMATQKVLNQVYIYPEWSLANRQAQTMTIVFVILMYSGGMPVLNLFGFVYCVCAYWLDKWCLLQGSQKPPQYNEQLMKISGLLFPVAAFLHSGFTLWSFGNQRLFPSNWSTLQGFFGGLIGVTEETYKNFVEAYNSSPKEEQADKWGDYMHARLFDFAREGCWLLLVIFCVFVVYYTLLILNALLFRPLLAPIRIAIRGYLAIGVKDDSSSPIFHEQQQDMLDRGYITSYRIHENPRYSVTLEHLHAGTNEVENAKNELSERESTQKTNAPTGAV